MPVSDGQFAPVGRSVLETVDTPCRCGTQSVAAHAARLVRGSRLRRLRRARGFNEYPLSFRAAATKPCGEAGCSYFWCIALLMLLFVHGSRAELPVTDRRGFASLSERVAAAEVLL